MKEKHSEEELVIKVIKLLQTKNFQVFREVPIYNRSIDVVLLKK